MSLSFLAQDFFLSVVPVKVLDLHGIARKSLITSMHGGADSYK